MKNLPQSQLTALHAESKWDRPLTNDQLEEFKNSAIGFYQKINCNRLHNGQLILYANSEVRPTMADLEFVRELSR